MWKVTGGLTVTAGLAAALLIWPSHRPSPRSVSVAAAQVRDALAKVNSWHLKGWRLIDGQQVLWEVWGSRSPFYYREQIGDRIIVDDGKLRLQQIPPDEKLGRPGGIYIRTPSYPLDANAPGLYETMISDWTRRGYKAARPWQETEEYAIFRELAHGMVGTGALTESMFTVDKQTKLPIRYEMKRTLKGGAPFTAEILDARFNVDTPLSVLGLERPDGYNFYDATESPAPGLPAANSTRQRGMTVHVEPLAVDPGGLIMVSVEGWLGNIPLRRPSMLHFQVESGRPAADQPPGFGPHRDSSGRPYTAVNLMHLNFVTARNGGTPILLAPVAPLKAREKPSDRLMVTLHASVWISSWASGSKTTMNSTRLLAQDVTVKLQLPARRARIRVDDYLEPNWRNRIRGLEEESVDVAIAQSRSSHYHWLFNLAIEPAVEYDAANQKVLYHPERADSDQLRQAIKQKLYWSREAVRLSKPGSRQQRGMRQHLINVMRDSARWLARIGDQGEALALLEQALALCRKHPEAGGYMRGQIEKQIAGLAKT